MRTLDASPALFMPYQKPKQSDRLAEIVNRVVGPLSLEQAAIHVNHVVSHQTIARLKRGMLGLESTVRQFAEAFADRMCEEYGGEISAKYGDCTPRDAADWLVGEAGFRPPTTSGDQGEPESAGDAAALAQKVEELSRKFDALYQAVVPDDYHSRRLRLYNEMRARLEADGYSVVPNLPSSHGGTGDQTAEDAETEIVELERVFRKRFKPDQAPTRRPD